MGDRERKEQSGESVPMTDGNLLSEGVIIREHSGDAWYCELQAVLSGMERTLELCIKR